MTCWLIGITLQCLGSNGLVFIQNYNVPMEQTDTSHAEAMGRGQVYYDFFCKGPAGEVDKELCARSRRLGFK